MDWMEGFIQDCKARGLSPHVIETYRSNVKAFLRAYTKPSRVRMGDLRGFLAYLRGRKLTGSTLKGYFAALSTFYDYLQFEGAVKNNPVPPFRKRYLRTRSLYTGETRQLISIEDMRRLINLAAGDIRAKTLMLFLAKTGIRRGELISMDIFDLNLEKGEFQVKPKPKRHNRLGFLDSEMTAALREYLQWREDYARENEKALWINTIGRRASRNFIYYLVVDYATLAGLHDPQGALNRKFTPHCFRHFFTTMFRRAGMSREFIQELRGDRRKEAVDIYDHIDIEELRKSYLDCIPRLQY